MNSAVLQLAVAQKIEYVFLIFLEMYHLFSYSNVFKGALWPRVSSFTLCSQVSGVDGVDVAVADFAGHGATEVTNYMGFPGVSGQLFCSELIVLI